MQADAIKLLHDRMKEFTIAAGIHPSRYNRVIKNVEKLSHDDSVELYQWLKNIYDGPYNEVKTVRNMVPLSAWDYYNIMQITGLREQLLLDEAHKGLQAAWKVTFKRKQAYAKQTQTPTKSTEHPKDTKPKRIQSKNRTKNNPRTK